MMIVIKEWYIEGNKLVIYFKYKMLDKEGELKNEKEYEWWENKNGLMELEIDWRDDYSVEYKGNIEEWNKKYGGEFK